MQCKHCGAEVGSEYRLCPYCRTELEYPTQNNGGSQPTIIVQNVINGTDTTQAQKQVHNITYNQPNTMCSKKSKALTLILVILLGYVGAHHFYVGKVGLGIVWLFTGGLFGFGWIYDIIKVASGTFKDGNGLPIQN